MELAGIIYLHDISHYCHHSGKPHENLGMFGLLCGDDSLANVVLGTTKWEDVTSEVGRQREVHLAETFWKEMLQYGSVMMRLQDDASSAWKVLNLIIQYRAFHKATGLLRIQDKHVELQTTIPQSTTQQLMLGQPQTSKSLQRQTRIARRMEEEHGTIKNCFRNIMTEVIL